MTNIRAKISILIPSYNHAVFLEQSVRSVWDQEYPQMELIVVDDGSVDESGDILARLEAESPIPMKVIRQSNGGICRALNRALAEASGEIIGILASDDVMAPHRLKEEMPSFEADKSLKVLFSNGQFQCDENRFGDIHKLIKPFLRRGIDATRNHLLSTAPGLYSQARLIKKDFLIDLGGFDEDTGSDDWSLHIRIFNSLTQESDFLFLDRVSFYYRVHRHQVHKVGSFMTVMKRKVIRKYFSIENRSKAICEEYIKRAILLFFARRFALGYRYLSLALKISFKHSVPWVCAFNLMYRMPGYFIRIIIRNR